VGIRRWFSKLLGPSDEQALERAEEEMAGTSLEEQEYLSGDVDALKADRKTGMLGGGSMREYERLGE
jgi:hypothetical protein